jgi:hypothetical protein
MGEYGFLGSELGVIISMCLSFLAWLGSGRRMGWSLLSGVNMVVSCALHLQNRHSSQVLGNICAHEIFRTT